MKPVSRLRAKCATHRLARRRAASRAQQQRTHAGYHGISLFGIGLGQNLQRKSEALVSRLALGVSRSRHSRQRSPATGLRGAGGSPRGDPPGVRP
eukprot:313467-Prymnesium_polylepis.1